MELIKIYTCLGFKHVIPFGFDHILFIIAFLLLQPNIGKALLIASLFTIAHSISLGIASAGYFLPPSSIIEPFITFSIVIVAVENIFFEKTKSWQGIQVFIFGLIHGMGFVSALNEIGIPDKQFFTALLSFNLGVEIAQIIVILLFYFLLVKWMSNKTNYKEKVVLPLSCIIGCIAIYWTIQRLFHP